MMWGGSKIEKPFEWQEWFAWYPVKLIDKRWIWLEKIDRKKRKYNAVIIGPSSPSMYTVEKYTYDYKLNNEDYRVIK